MKQILLLLFALLILNGVSAQQRIDDLIPKAEKMSYYAYQLGKLQSLPAQCRGGCDIKEAEVNKYFTQHKDVYKLVDIVILNKYVEKIYFINLKEQQEYESSGLAEKSRIFREAKTAQEWLNLRKTYSDFRIRGVSDQNIIRTLRAENILMRDFMVLFPEYEKDVKFKEAMLNTSSNKKDILIYLEIYDDSLAAQTFVLEHDDFLGMNVSEYVEIFNEKSQVEKWLMEHLRKKSIEEIYEALGKDVTERYVDKLIEKFHVLNSEEMPSYLKCTHNDEKAANMICYILQTLDGAKVTLKWLLNPNLYEVFVYEGYVDWRNDGIKYAEIILPYISNATQKSRIENAIHHAVEDIRNYRQKIAALMEIYEQKEQAYQAKMCEQCEVDPNKTELPYNETLEGLIGKYTQNNPGKIVMKNSSEYEFYLDSAGKWYIPGFLSNHTFKNTQEMLKYFLGECQKVHCK